MVYKILKVSFILFTLSCATPNSIKEWQLAVLNERDETIKCIKTVCDNTMTVEHCLSLVEVLCK